MTNRPKAGELNPLMIIQSFKSEEAPDPATIVVQPADNVDDAAKNKPRKRRGNYDEIFLKKKEFKSRQPVYISQNIHMQISRLSHILALSGKEISVGGYIDNVLEEHLEQHKEEIDDLCKNINKS